MQVGELLELGAVVSLIELAAEALIDHAVFSEELVQVLLAHAILWHRWPSFEVSAGRRQEPINSYFLIIREIDKVFLEEVLGGHLRRILNVRIRRYLVWVAPIELAHLQVHLLFQLRGTDVAGLDRGLAEFAVV